VLLDVVYNLVANAYWAPLEFAWPETPAASSAWRRLIDTSIDSPGDAHGFADAPTVGRTVYFVPARTVILLYDDSSAR